MVLDSCRTGRNAGSEDRYRTVLLFAGQGWGSGPTRPSAPVGCWPAHDSGRNRVRCVPAPAATPMASNVRMDPTMRCLLSPVAYVHQLIGLEGSSPAPGPRVGSLVSPRSGAIFLDYSLIFG